MYIPFSLGGLVLILVVIWLVRGWRSAQANRPRLDVLIGRL